MTALLPQIASPADLQGLADAELAELAQEMRDELVRVLQHPPGPLRQQPRRRRAVPRPAPDLRLPPRPPHLGHRPSDLSAQAHHRPLSRSSTPSAPRGGLMGYPNPHESQYDLFMTGHAGCSVSCALGLKAGDDLLRPGRPPQRRRHRRRRPAVGHRLRGAQQRRRTAQEPAGHPQRQRDVHLPARRRPGALPRPGPADQLLPGLEAARPRSAGAHSADRRHGHARHRADQGRAEGVPDRRHAVRGAGLPLLRPDRRPRPADACAAGCAT